MKLAALLIILSILLSPLSQATQVCARDGHFVHTIKQLQAEYNQAPNQVEPIVQLAMGYEAMGMAEQALKLADKALSIDSSSGAAIVVKVHALHQSGRVAQALDLAIAAFEDSQQQYKFHRRLKSWLRHSILAIYLQSGQFKQAEQLIVKHYPKVLALADKPVTGLSLQLGVPLHTLEPLIYILEQTGRGELATKLAAHLQGFSAATFFKLKPEQLQPTQHWMLASIWAALADQRHLVVDSLKKAYQGGFKMGWRFNYAHHPAYWPLLHEPSFVEFIAEVEQEMLQARGCL